MFVLHSTLTNSLFHQIDFGVGTVILPPALNLHCCLDSLNMQLEATASYQVFTLPLYCSRGWSGSTSGLSISFN